MSDNHLRFIPTDNGPAGFARFVLEAMNPNVRDIAVEGEQGNLNAILGTPLRKTWAHYCPRSLPRVCRPTT
jgi:hypothetical protein